MALEIITYFLRMLSLKKILLQRLLIISCSVLATVLISREWLFFTLKNSIIKASQSWE